MGGTYLSEEIQRAITAGAPSNIVSEANAKSAAIGSTLGSEIALLINDAIENGQTVTGNPIVDQALAQYYASLTDVNSSVTSTSPSETLPVVSSGEVAAETTSTDAVVGTNKATTTAPVFITDQQADYVTTLKLSGTGTDRSYTFYVPPESVDISVPSRVGTYQSIGGGSYFDHLGEGIVNITISGHTGFRRGITKPEGRINLGYAQYILLKDIISAYNDACVMGNAHLAKLQLTIGLMDSPAFGQWDVVVKELSLKRSTQSVLLFRYSLSLLCVSKNRLDIARPREAVTRQVPEPPPFKPAPDQVRVAATGSGLGQGSGQGPAKKDPDKKDVVTEAVKSTVLTPKTMFKYTIPPFDGTYVNENGKSVPVITKKTGSTVQYMGSGTVMDPTQLSWRLDSDTQRYSFVFQISVENFTGLHSKTQQEENDIALITISYWSPPELPTWDIIVDTDIFISNTTSVWIEQKLETGDDGPTYIEELSTPNAAYQPLFSDARISKRQWQKTFSLRNPWKYIQNNKLYVKGTFAVKDSLKSVFNSKTIPPEWRTYGFTASATCWKNVYLEKPDMNKFKPLIHLVNPTSILLHNQLFGVERNSVSITNASSVNPTNQLIFNETDSSTKNALTSVLRNNLSKLFSQDIQTSPIYGKIIMLATGNFQNFRAWWQTNDKIINLQSDFVNSLIGRDGFSLLFSEENNAQPFIVKGLPQTATYTPYPNISDFQSFGIYFSDVNLRAGTDLFFPFYEWNAAPSLFANSALYELILTTTFMFYAATAYDDKDVSVKTTQTGAKIGAPNNIIDIIETFYGVKLMSSSEEMSGDNSEFNQIKQAIIEANKDKGLKLSDAGGTRLTIMSDTYFNPGTVIMLPAYVGDHPYKINQSAAIDPLNKNDIKYFTNATNE